MAAATLDQTDPLAEPAARFDPDAEVAKCAANCAYFINAYGIIDDSQGHGENATGTMPFQLWPAQVRLIWELMAFRLLVLLKARQLGMSWAVCGYVLWRCLFQRGQLIFLLSKGQKEANELLRRVKAIYQRLPQWLRDRLPRVDPRKDNASEILWTNGSSIQSLPATRNAGIGNAASVVVMDEAAHMKYGDELYLNIKPTIDAGGQLILLSTANGIGGLFHTIWEKATEGLNGFRTIFIPWWCRPGRDRKWFRARVAESNDPKLIPQNYPANPVEAFLASGNMRFDAAWINAQAQNLREPLAPAELPPALRDIPGLKVWTLPQPGRSYILGGDVSEGLETGDYDACPVLDAETWEQVAEIHGHWEPDEYAAALMKVADHYNHAWVAIERNNHGHAVLIAFALARDPETDEPRPFTRVYNGEDGRPGFLTTAKSKGPGVDLIAAALRDGLVTIRSVALLNELRHFKRLRGGKLGATKGKHDDRVMGLLVALCSLRLGHLRPSQGAPAAGGGERKPTSKYLGHHHAR
jgi:hypothetical protein